MKKTIYLIFLLLTACGHNEETIKETDEMIKAIKIVFEGKENKQNADYWQKAYLHLEIMLEKLKKADFEVIELAKEAKTLFEESYVFRKNNDVTGETLLKSMIYIANTITGKGTSLPDVINQNNVEQKRLIDKFVKLNFKINQLDIKLCNKYQLNCKAKTSDKPDQKKETKSN
jgi:hypothetical protein